MNEQPKSAPSMRGRSEILRFFAWITSWRGIRRILIVAAWTATIIGLWYGEENWRGQHAWNQYRKGLGARGVSLDYSSYIPKPIPDDQNFAAIPFLKSLTNGNLTIMTNDLWYKADDNVFTTKNDKDRGHRHFTDLVAWAMAAAAVHEADAKKAAGIPAHEKPPTRPGQLPRDLHFESGQADLASRAAAAPVVLEGMKPDAAAFAEMQNASSRPFARFPVEYDQEDPWATRLAHLAHVKQLALRLELKICAELAAGQNAEAWADEILSLRLADSIETEPSAISYAVRVACLQNAVQALWEGLAEHRWTEAQLEGLQARFLTYDFLTDGERCLRAERALGVAEVELVKKKGFGTITDLGDDNNGLLGNGYHPFHRLFAGFIVKTAPSGWYEWEKLNYNQTFDQVWSGVADLTARTISPGRSLANENGQGQIIRGSFLQLFLSHQTMSVLLGAGGAVRPFKIAVAQTVANQAALACALERYRLTNGQFPETLDALAPRFITRAPNDVIGGAPYKYRRTPDGKFILYSIGWNEKDDGGAPGKTLFDQTQGDWVWTYPPE